MNNTEAIFKLKKEMNEMVRQRGELIKRLPEHNFEVSQIIYLTAQIVITKGRVDREVEAGRLGRMVEWTCHCGAKEMITRQALSKMRHCRKCKTELEHRKSTSIRKKKQDSKYEVVE